MTGASSGIGADIARSLARRGHDLVLAARREERLAQLAEELRERDGVRAEVVACDLGEPDERTRLLAAVDERGLRVDVLVNNAGYGTAGLFQRLDGEREAAMVRLNCEVVVDLCARLVPAMVERGEGAVLNVASVAGFQPLPTQATYGGTKALVLHFTQGLAADLHGTGVTATVLCPGPVRTEFVEVAGVTDDVRGLPELVWASAEEVAEAGVRGLERGRTVVIPGRLNRLLATGGQLTPRSLLLGVGRRVYRLGAR